MSNFDPLKDLFFLKYEELVRKTNQFNFVLFSSFVSLIYSGFTLLEINAYQELALAMISYSVLTLLIVSWREKLRALSELRNSTIDFEKKSNRKFADFNYLFEERMRISNEKNKVLQKTRIDHFDNLVAELLYGFIRHTYRIFILGVLLCLIVQVH